MWLLIKTNSDKIFFISKSDLIVGRKRDLDLQGDDSISRVHAQLKVIDGQLYLTDQGSRYGTYLNEKLQIDEKLEPKVAVKLNPNDRIRFGRFDNEWSVSQMKMKTVLSIIDNERKAKLDKVLELCQVASVEEWDDEVTHLTMPPRQCTLTMKLLYALASGIPVVTSDYWVVVQQNILNNIALPKTSEHLPQLKNEYINVDSVSLGVNEDRKQLFAGKSFVFTSSKQMSVFENIIKAAGGKCSRAKELVNISKLTAKGVICVRNGSDSHHSQSSQATIDKLQKALSKKDLRLIPEVEIGMAILRCTIEQFCNPAFLQIENFNGFQRTSTSQIMISKSKVLIENTCDNGESSGFKRPQNPSRIVDSIDLSDDEDEKILPTRREIPETLVDDVMSMFDYEPSPVNIPETMHSCAGIFSAVNIAETQPSQNSSEPIESQPSSSKNASNIFEFDSLNSKKRKAPVVMYEEEDEVAAAPVPDIIVKPAAKKPKNNPVPKIVHPDSDDEILEPTASTLSRKRTATTASKGGLFSFNRPVAKRSRQMSVELDNSNSVDSVNSANDISSGLSRVSSGESLLPSIPQSKRQRSFTSLSGSSIDYSGVWLSKTFANCSIKTVKEEDIKKEYEEIDGLGTEDIKPQNICIYFQVQQIKMDLKSVTDRSDTICNESGQKKFKKFVKKKNYKSQSEVLRTKLVSADETFDQNFDF